MLLQSTSVSPQFFVALALQFLSNLDNQMGKQKGEEWDHVLILKKHPKGMHVTNYELQMSHTNLYVICCR